MGENILLLRDKEWQVFEGRTVGEGLWKDIGRLNASPPVWLPHVDRGCVCYLRDGKRSFLVMYLEPRLRSIFYANPAGGDKYDHVRSYKIILPHAYIGISFSNEDSLMSGYAGISPRPIQDLEDPLGVLPLPNIGNDGKICIGHDNYFRGMTRQQAAEHYMRRFLSACFNNGMGVIDECTSLPAAIHPDYTAYDRLYVDGELVREDRNENDLIFRKWQSHSRKHGTAGILKLDWRYTGLSIAKWVAREGLRLQGQNEISEARTLTSRLVDQALLRRG